MLSITYSDFVITKYNFFLGAYFYGMTSSGLNVLDHMYMAEVVAMILVTAMTVQVNRLNNLNKSGRLYLTTHDSYYNII